MLETTIAGSLPKPEWLAEPEKLRAKWAAEGETLSGRQQDAALLWIKLQEESGIDIATDGEQFRIHFVHGFSVPIGTGSALEGHPTCMSRAPAR